jgi:hypothetical protein
MWMNGTVSRLCLQEGLVLFRKYQKIVFYGANDAEYGWLCFA